jgi:hypothetical protein
MPDLRTLQSKIPYGRKHWQRLFALCALLLASVSVLYSTVSAKEQYIKLALEDRTTLQVGQLAVLSIPSDHPYRINPAGEALELVRHSKSRAVFRAVHTGQETILLSPEVPKGECIACATHHYFITVAQPGDTGVEQ